MDFWYRRLDRVKDQCGRKFKTIVERTDPTCPRPLFKRRHRTWHSTRWSISPNNLRNTHTHKVSQSVSGTLDRPRVVAPSKTCSHVRSSRRRWRWAQCMSSSICCTHVRQGRPRWRFHSGLMSGLPYVRASTARRSAEWAGVASGSRRTWPKMESRLRKIRIAKPSSPVWLIIIIIGDAVDTGQPASSWWRPGD